MIFSNRTPDDLSHNAITQAIEHNQKPLYDLTQSNPTHCGFVYPKDLLECLSNPESLNYEPQAFGMLKTREVLARHLSTINHIVQPENLLLAASTSEAYSYLFKLLGDPRDSFMVPTPGYPLLDHLLHLEGLELIPYSLQLKADWPIQYEELESLITPFTKGIVSVNPHNPTGAFLNEKDQISMLNLCEQHSMAYISDEVFSDYAYGSKPASMLNEKVLTFRMGGLSKSLGLPQLKLSWTEVQGPANIVGECKNRLELIADTYLSVNTPVQEAMETLLSFAPDIQKQILNRVLNNRKRLEKSFKDLQNVKIWPAQGGWYGLIEVLIDGIDDESLVIDLLNKHQVLVQPGGFYDFPKESCFLVLSLLPQLDIFEAGVIQLRKHLEQLN